MAYITSGIK